MSDSSRVFSWTDWLWLGLLWRLTKPNVSKLKLRHSFHDCQVFPAITHSKLSFSEWPHNLSPVGTWQKTSKCSHISRTLGVKRAKLSTSFESHILPQMKRMQMDWSRGVILSMSRRQDRFKVHQNPKHWGKHMPLYRGPVSWNQSLCGRFNVKPSVRHPVQLWTPRSLLTCVGNTCLCSSFGFCFYVSLSTSLSHTHTPQTHARTSRYTRRKKSLFQFCWGNMTVIFGLLLALLRGEAGVQPTPRAG